MLKLTLSVGEYLQVGEDVKIAFLGGSDNHFKIIVDAPKEVNIARSNAIEKHTGEKTKKFVPEKDMKRAASEEKGTPKFKKVVNSNSTYAKAIKQKIKEENDSKRKNLYFAGIR